MEAMQGDDEQITAGLKLRYLLGRIFVNREFCRSWFPFFYRHPYLIPFLWIFRIVRGLLVKRKMLTGEWKAVKKM